MRFLSWQKALIAAGLAIPALLLLYFLKLKRHERRVSSTLLWKKAVQDLQVNAPFQKLRKNLLLFLQLLILAAVLFGLGEPVAKFMQTADEKVVVLIDRSGSMNTVEADGRTRLEHAKLAAIEYLESHKGDAQAMVISFAESADVACTFTHDLRRLVRRIEDIEPTDGATRIGEALQLAAAYSTKIAIGGEGWTPDAIETGLVVLLTDGRIADAAEETIIRAQPKLFAVGQAADNVGIVAFDAQRQLDRPGMISVFVSIENFGPNQITSDVSLELDGRLLNVQSVALGPAPAGDQKASGAQSSLRNVIFEIAHESGGVLEIRVHREDALLLDNVVRAPIDPPRSLRVLLVADREESRYFFDRAFRHALEITDYTEMSASEYESASEDILAVEGRSAFDLVVIDHHDTARLSPGNYLFFGGIPKVEGLSRGRAVEEQIFVTWRESHPLLRHVPLENVIALQWRRLTLPDHAVKLIEGPDSTVMAFISDPGHRYVVAAFDLLDTNFRWKEGFPIFLHNCVAYLPGGGLADASRLLKPGQTMTLAVPPGAEKLKLTNPDGSRHEIDVADQITVSYANTHRCGLYRAAFDDSADTRSVFAVNTLNPAESLIVPTDSVTIGAEAVSSKSGELKANRPLWQYAVAAALLVLLIEWWVYNRRVMI